MKFRNHPVVRGSLFIFGLVVWIGCVLAMLAIALTWHEVASEPIHENNMAGIVWIFFGPGLPIGMGVASGLLYSGWNVFTAVNRRIAHFAVWTVPGLALGFLLGLVLTPALASPLVMDVAIGLHVVAFVSLHGVTFFAGRMPWTSPPSDAEQSTDRDGTSQWIRRSVFVLGALVWLLLLVGTVLHCVGSIAQAVLPVESTADVKHYSLGFGWTAPLLALVSYGLVEWCADALETASEWWTRLARGSAVVLFLTSSLVLIALGEIGLLFAIVESLVVAAHIGSAGAAVVLTVRRVGAPWTIPANRR